jgi:membrane protease YdiL (CAAX protease family)
MGIGSEREIWRVSEADRKERLLELAVFLFLIVPSMALSFFVVRQGAISFDLVAVSVILRDLALLSLVLFFLRRNSEPVERIGWKFADLRREVLLGIALFVPFFFGAGLLETALLSLGFSAPSTPLPSLQAAGGTGQTLLGVVLVAVVAATEESIFRGYLILRFKNLAGSSFAAVVLSAVIFSIGHGYEGSAGVITVGFMGLVFAIVYLWRMSLVAPIVMHFLQDFIGIVLTPLFMHR